MGAILVLWAGGVAWASGAGVIVAFPLPFFAAVAAALLIGTIAIYALNARLRAGVERFGLRNLTALHVWRIPAVLAFF